MTNKYIIYDNPYSFPICNYVRNIHAQKILCDTNETTFHYAIFFCHKMGLPNQIICIGGCSTLKWKHMTSTHAEIDAMSKIMKWKNRPYLLDLYVLRFSRQGYLGNSRPCSFCINELEKSGFNIKHVYYSNDKNQIIRENFNYMEKNHIPSGMRMLQKMRDIIMIKKIKQKKIKKNVRFKY